MDEKWKKHQWNHFFKGYFQCKWNELCMNKIKFMDKVCYTCNLPYGWQSLMMAEFYSWSILAMQMEIGHINELYGWTLTAWIKLNFKNEINHKLNKWNNILDEHEYHPYMGPNFLRCTKFLSHYYHFIYSFT